MPRRVLYAYVFPYLDLNTHTRRARVFCSPDCGNATLYEPVSWNTLRVRVSQALQDAIVCEGCELTLAEANEEESRG